MLACLLDRMLIIPAAGDMATRSAAGTCQSPMCLRAAWCLITRRSCPQRYQLMRHLAELQQDDFNSDSQISTGLYVYVCLYAFVFTACYVSADTLQATFLQSLTFLFSRSGLTLGGARVSSILTPSCLIDIIYIYIHLFTLKVCFLYAHFILSPVQ